MQDKLTERTLKRNRRAKKIITEWAVLMFFLILFELFHYLWDLDHFSSCIIDTGILFNEIVDNSFIN